MLYIISPYTGTPEEQSRRHAQVQDYTQRMLALRYVVFSPIVYSVALPGITDDFAHWQEFDDSILRLSHGAIVLELDGFENSRGCRWEIMLCTQLRIPMARVRESNGVFRLLSSDPNMPNLPTEV